MESNTEEAAASKNRHKWNYWWPRLVAIFCIVCVWWNVFRPNTFRQIAEATCQVETRLWYVAENGQGDSIRIAVSDGHTTDAMGRSCYADTTHASGVFVSESGCLVAPASIFLQATEVLPSDSLRNLLLKEKARLQTLAKEQKEAVKELEYYARTHSVIDEGYNEVMHYGSLTYDRQKKTDSLVCLIDTLLTSSHLKVHLRHQSLVRVSAVSRWTAANRAEICQQRFCTTFLRRNKDVVLLQISDKKLPSETSFVSLYNIGTKAHYRVGYPKGKYLPDLIPEDVGQKMPQCASNGLLQIDCKGNAVCLLNNGHGILWKEVRKLCLQGGSLRWITENAWAATSHMLLPTKDSTHTTRGIVREWPQNIGWRRKENRFYGVRQDSTGLYAGRFSKNKANGIGFKQYADGSRYFGLFENNARQGYGTFTDSVQRIYAGTWQADSLPQGTLQDSVLCYIGNFNAKLQRHGSGICHIPGKSYYDGQWNEDHRQGFGFSVGERHMVRAGIWKKDGFRGEQMIYTADRVYGIDISRYQHEIGRKRYGIDWQRLRITRLGVANTTRIRGAQNYPVTFVYVKATEGTSSFNRYYAADIAAARKRGMRVGAYHFFSTRTGGAAQAIHFIKRANLRRGDLPPVLDVEPSDEQIAAMGGKQALFREMAAWLRIVRNRCGTMPILYISQGFVNKYMVHAPSTLLRYQVWIARYGEYKPYVHLLYWQLSPYGRVAGIHGEVDINIFNGSRKQFQRFAAANGVR